jgi:hypothetical protein
VDEVEFKLTHSPDEKPMKVNLKFMVKKTQGGSCSSRSAQPCNSHNPQQRKVLQIGDEKKKDIKEMMKDRQYYSALLHI